MNILSEYFKYKNNTSVIGLTNELNAFYVLSKFDNKSNILVVAPDLYQANMFYDKLSSYSDKVLLFPMDDFITTFSIAISPDLKVKRLETLELLNTNNNYIVVTNLMGYLRFLPDKNNSSKFKVELKKGININRDSFIKILDEFGYTKESLTTATGNYSVRGYIIDVFLIKEEHPIRIELFGNEIDSIRYFDEDNQLSIGDIKEIEILPIKEINTKVNSSLFDYLNNPFTFYLDEDAIIKENEKLIKEMNEYKMEKEINDKLMFDYNDIKVTNKIYLNHFDNNNRETIEYIAKGIDNFNSNFELLKDFVNNKIRSNKTIVFCLSRTSEINAISKLFPSSKTTTFNKLMDSGINIVNYKINNGFEFDKYVFISEYDIEKANYTSNIKYRNTLKMGKKINNFDQLNVGDYVVHYAHGIGVYGGITTLVKNGVNKDYLFINYANNDKVYVPVEKITSIFKYSSKDGDAPRINSLSSTSWEKTKRALRKKINDISKQLLELYAKRANTNGPEFIDDSMEEMFANGFEYELTKDQEKSISDVLTDLKTKVPMDRLLCGDVGFGKTEVAFRAMFKTIENGYQVAYLCPTTILSKQQYLSALDRFSDFPVNIRLVNRFTTKKDMEETINGLKTGKVDIVFGTHRLLSNEIKYKNLGLLVIDEEQRFGVSHKEKIKQIKENVNVLTLSATPIPRTLKMSLSGLRDLSIIDTAPVNRYPIQTYVMAESELLIKDAINKELARHGQVFILYNRVETIESKLLEIKELVPSARITYAHGQMSKQELENVMADFIDYKYDILVCTTIIETGIDIPNANTLIVLNADTFGLSQLYQLRGRVGRSNRIAYAYLMYNKNKMLNDIAIKRLEAIKEFTELGSGYRIAMRDLSLRGAGDILGSEQAGFVDTVGVDLYMKLIDEEIRRLKGEDIPEEDSSNTSLIDVETHIEDNYVSDEDLKIEIHQKINEIDSYDKLIEIKNEIEDRFGKISPNIEVYMYEEWFEKLAKKLNIINVKQSIKSIELTIPSNIVEKIKFDKVFMLAYKICPKFTFKSISNNVIVTLPITSLEKHFVYYLVPLLTLVLQEVEK